MFFNLLLGLALSFLVLTFTVEAQHKKRTGGKAPNPTVIASRPGVYLSFERRGNRRPLRDDESGKGIWLRLHNNMRYSINICTFGISEEGEQLIMHGKDTQIGIYYDVAPNPLAITEERPAIDVPLGYPVGGTCHELEVKPGNSLLFSVPGEHLVNGLSIKLDFSYGWEEMVGNNPRHTVYFNSLSIPKN